MDNSPIPKAFASVTELGAPQRYFPIKALKRTGPLTALIIFLLGASLILLYGLYVTYVAYQQHGPAMIDDNLIWPAVIAFTLFFFGLIAGGLALADWKKGVALYEKGFAMRNQKGIRSWRWEDIAAIMAAVTRRHVLGIYIGTAHLYTLYDQQNKQLVLDDTYGRVEELAKVIEECTFPLLYGRAADQYNAGRTLVFGPVAVSKGEICLGKKTYPWTEVKGVSVQRGSLKIAKKDGNGQSGASAEVADIPNVSVLLAVIDQMVGVKTG